ncbi:metallophosphoesterase family protein [Gemmatimonas groenlandica]|uniref:Metallophosphoesterase n=1 Tax=Gemmatimonas groenlandica TaxID=2732249 RepID=A0A6M4IT90_9BACT|nr:metallophosphoesterase family protein [Gemmatimonas groenlandica]QJR37870.1 metallophosphoesterase [Gemmatimonas groenlandica]
MRTLVHLSDLHFGRVDTRLLAPLIDRIVKIQPDLVVVSGDLTQRARSDQFKAAREFLDVLPRPQIVVPGNHDIPLHNVFDRFVRPLQKYRRHISDDLEPAYVDGEIAVLGVNTARSATIKGGRINQDQLGRLRARMTSVPGGTIKVVVTHHPFDLPSHYHDGNLVGRAPAAMQLFAECGVDLLLAGHFHASHAGDTAVRYRIGGYVAVAAQAGTATSTRGRGEVNAFNLVHLDPSHITIERYGWDAESGTFTASHADVFTRTAGGWSRSTPSDHAR